MSYAVKITVRRKHILAGMKGDRLSCPIALALREELLTDNVLVGTMDFQLNGRVYTMAEDMREFVRKFDDGKLRWRGKPYNFYLAKAAT